MLTSGFIPINRQPGLFVRELSIEHADGSNIEYWVYIYNQNLRNTVFFSSGNYAKFRAVLEP